MPLITDENTMRLFWEEACRRGMSFSSADVLALASRDLPNGDTFMACATDNCWLFACERDLASGKKGVFVSACAPMDLCTLDDGEVYEREFIYSLDGVYLPSMSKGVSAARAEQGRIKRLLRKGRVDVGSPVQAARPGASCLGRCVLVTAEGLCDTFVVETPRGPVLEYAKDWRDCRGYITNVPPDALDGWAECVRTGCTRFNDYWGAGRVLSIAQARLTGWRRAESGNLMTPKTGPWRPHAPGSEGERKALAEGFQPVRELTADDISTQALRDVCQGRGDARGAYIAWFTQEHAARRHASAQHAMLYERYFAEFDDLGLYKSDKQGV